MKRLVVALLVLGLLAAPLAAEAQPPASVVRIGFLGDGLSADAFARGLRERGYSDHKHFVIERRGGGSAEHRAVMAADLADVIVAITTLTASAAKNATTATPIVMIGGDPVGSGLVASLSRPGGNVTGLSGLAPEMNVKRLELLQEVVPKLAHAALLRYSSLTTEAMGPKSLESAANRLGVSLTWLQGRTTQPRRRRDSITGPAPLARHRLLRPARIEPSDPHAGQICPGGLDRLPAAA